METRLAPLSCPLCHDRLEPVYGPHGVVWLCEVCRAGAVTVPVLRRIAPDAFVNHLWQAALHEGRRSRIVCPSCDQPFTEFVGTGIAVSPRLEVCVRCFWVWLGPRAERRLFPDRRPRS